MHSQILPFLNYYKHIRWIMIQMTDKPKFGLVNFSQIQWILVRFTFLIKYCIMSKYWENDAIYNINKYLQKLY